MQSTRTAHPLPPVEARGRPQAFRAPTEPFGELEKQLSADLSASGRAMLAAARTSGPGSEAVALARGDYLIALNRLSRLRPGMPLWQLERMALPEDLKYVKAGIFGLPPSLVPFSPGDVWRNRELEDMVLARSPPEMDPPLVRRLAILLDRFVRSDMAIESISDFYRPSVARLADSGGADSPRYVHDLLSAARSLSKLAVPFLLAQNASLLNLSLHKDRCTKTGDALGESEPARRQSYIRNKKPAPAVARIRIGSTALSRLGVELGSDEVANTLSQKWGLPMPEELSEPRPPGAAREEMEACLTFNLSTGRETTYSHPDLQGMEFSSADCEKAYRLVSEGARARLGAESSGEEAGMLAQSEEFGRACDDGDARTQLRWALAVIKMMERSDALSAEDPGRDRLEVYGLAAEDFRFALSMVAQYEEERDNPSMDQHMVPISIRRMRQLGEEAPAASPFDLALSVIDEKRKNRQSLTTMIPARSLNHPPGPQPEEAGAEPEITIQIPPQQAPPEDLADAAQAPQEPREEFAPERPTMEMPLVPEAIAGIVPVQNVALDPELENALPPITDADSAAVRHLSRYLAHCFMYGFSENQMPVFLRPAYAKLVEPGRGKVVRLLTKEIPSDAPSAGFATSCRQFEQEGYLVRPDGIIGAVTALVKGTDFSALRSVPPKPAQAAEEHPEAEEETVRREFEARPEPVVAPPDKQAEKPLLVLPLDNCILDDRLEALLPEKTNPRARYIRHASRILGYYLIFGVEDSGVHELYLDAVRSLRGGKITHNVPIHYIDGGPPREGRFKELHGFDFAPSEVVRRATEIVDGCDTSKVLLREDYALALARAAAEARTAQSSLAEADTDLRQAEADIAEADTDLAPVPQRRDSLPSLLRNLMQHEKELIAGVMGAQSCDEAALEAFLDMHPGRRELAIRNYIDSRWTAGDWRAGLERARAAGKSVHGQLGLSAPAREQLAEAVRDPSALTAGQRGMVASIFMIDESAVQPVHLDGFAAWVSGDRERISSFWEGFFVDPHRLILLAGKMAIPNSRFSPEEQSLLSWLYDKPFESITAKEAYNPAHATECARVMQELKNFWVYTPLEERRRLWKRTDLLSAGELAHRLRFGKGPALGRDELRVLGAVLGRRISDQGEITEDDMGRLTAAMVQHTTSGPETLRKVRADGSAALGPEEKAILSMLLGRKVESAKELTGADLDYAQHVLQQRSASGGDEKYYYSELVNIASLGRDAHPASLLAAARREGEFCTLLESLGEKAERAEGRLDYSAGLSTPKRKNGGYAKTNDDSFSGAVVTLPDGRRITLDLVCDGMGGMDKGAAGPLPNGQVASNIAKDVFEISAVAGWITTPEEARRVIVVADLAVTMEQMHRKASLDRPAQELPPLEFEAQRFKQQNVMGTTMVIGMQDGRKFWGIHCGDSEWKVLRGDSISYEATGHSFEYHVKEQYGITLEDHYRSQFSNAAQQTVMQSWMASPEHAAALSRQDPQWVAEFQKQVGQTLEAMVAERVSVSKSIVSAGLAQNTQYLQINNRESGYEPIYLRDGDVTIVVSDGITVPICNHEFRTLIDMAGGDLPAACKLAVEHAESRMTKGPHQTMCSCQLREGKNDDKSVTMRDAAQGFRDREVFGRLQADPRAFAYSPERLAMLGLCANAQTDLPEVKETLDAFIDAAESAPDRTRSDVFTVSVATIFDIISQRKERDELLDYIAPRVGGWSGLLMKKLLKSPDFSPRKEAMLAIVARSVDPGSLAALTKARNPQICAAVSRMAGGEPVSETQPSAYPEPIFRSMKSESGRQLGPLETRYLDSYLIDLHESPIVQETATKLRVLPRDLEIMVFNVYSGFNPAMAVDPHATAEGQNIISEVWIHLSTGDAKNILTSSYLIYRLRETAVEPSDLGKYLDVLWRSVKSMDSTTTYARTYFNEAIRLIKQFNPEDPRC